jgi:hypothetical protein
MVPIKPENIDAWRRAGHNNPAALYAILDVRAAVLRASDGSLNRLAS